MYGYSVGCSSDRRYKHRRLSKPKVDQDDELIEALTVWT
jgi:hypothetical protein